jgi:hypothetical protein
MMMKMVKRTVLAGMVPLAMMLLSPMVWGDYKVDVQDNLGNDIFVDSHWDGSLKTVDYNNNQYTFKAWDFNKPYKAGMGFSMAQIDDSNPSQALSSVNFSIRDNSKLGPLTGDSKNARFSTEVENYKAGDYIQALGSFNNFQGPSTTLTVSSTTSHWASTHVDASFQFQLNVLSGFATFGNYGNKLVTELEVKSVPEPASLMLGLLGIPCLGGIARMVRRKGAAVKE